MDRVAWNKGRKQTPEQREKNRISHLGQIPWIKGKHHSEGAKCKISLVHKGKQLSEEHKANLSLAMKGRVMTEEHKAKLRVHLDRLRQEGITPTDFGGKPYCFPKGNKPWNTGIPDNPGLVRIRQLPHGMLGKHLSKEHKAKISVAREGKFKRFGADNPFYRHKHSPEFIENRRQKWAGEGNPTYRDGQSPERYPLAFNKQLRRMIRERDNYNCQLCGKLENGRTHAVHHIDYNKFNNKPENLIALCLSCNSRVNISRDGWQMYFKDLLISRGIFKMELI